VDKTDRGWYVYDGQNEVAGSFPNRADADWPVKGERATGSHPLVENWQDLMARRTMKEAVDGGYDRLTWVTGEQTAARYDLSKYFDAIYYRKLNDGTFGVVGTTVDGKQMNIADRATAEELPRIIGKDVASRIVAGEGKESTATAGKKRLDGLDLKVGGEWATKLYDESMVNRFNKIGKRYGVQVEKTKIATEIQTTSYEAVRSLSSPGWTVMSSEGLISSPTFPTMKEAQTYADSLGITKPITVHSIKITPEMRKAIGATKFHPFADLP
jgi:hypothetical protein